jgi:hypothetical protein
LPLTNQSDDEQEHKPEQQRTLPTSHLMPTIPGSLITIFAAGITDADGNPLAGGFVQFYATNTTTPKDTFSDVLMTEVNPNPVVLDGTGAAVIFAEPGGYDWIVYDANLVELWSIVGWEDIGQTFLAGLGVILSTGSSDVTSGYTVLPTDQLITVNSSGGPNPCVINLPPADEYPLILVIKNLGGTPLAVTPNGAETIDTLAAAYTVPAAVSPLFPSIELANDGVTSWWIRASHGI